ncbi:MAG TPA: right-handed parallel beta-helix repeat-containing protein [bacterium]|nr:right-handed parallel beta-helix repeat-containing protein [bacterium]
MKTNRSTVSGIFTYFLVIGLLLWIAPISSAQGTIQLGDVTADGTIDGRDALVVLRAIAGLETLTAEQVLQGDVYPNPGTGGRSIGDGVLTEDDARQILRYAVRLIPAGDLTGDYLGVPPTIRGFEPRSGSPGALVTVYGENFASGSLQNNLVRIGDIPAPVQELTGTSIVIRVPEEAQSGLIEVLTPGGAAQSKDQFTVTQEIQGTLALGGGLDAQDFTIVTGYDETNAIDTQGHFNVDTQLDGISLIGAVSDAEGNNTFLALMLPGMDEGTGAKGVKQANPTVQVNALSTAKTLLYLHPFFATDNPVAVRRFMELLDSIPEVATLAGVIAERYPQGANGLDDPAVFAAWSAAVIAIMDNLPPGLVFSTDTPAGAKPSTIRQADASLSSWLSPMARSQAGRYTNASPMAGSAGQSVLLRRVGADYVYAEYDSDSGAITVGYPETCNYSPLDWLIAFYRVDPADMPMGLGNPYLAARRGIRRLGEEQISMLPSNQWTQRIDIVSYSISYAFDNVSSWIGPDSGGFRINRNQEGVYAMRIYSGGMSQNDPQDFQTIRNIDGGIENANRAMIINIGVAVVDLWSLASGSEESFLRDALKQAAIKASIVLTQEAGRLYPPGAEDRTLEIIFRMIMEMGKGISEAATNAGLSAARQRLSDTLSSALRSSNAITAVLGRISSLGKIGERVAGMMGYLLNPLGWELSPAGPTPLETCFVQIGDPFSPRITQLNPGRSGRLSSVIISGEHFQSDPRSNIVRFGDYYARVLEVVSPNQMVVEVPRLVPNFEYLTVTVETTASSTVATAPTRFYVDPIPFISELSPTRGYSRPTNEQNPFYNQPGSVVEIRGENLDSPRGPWALGVKVNDIDATVISASSRSMLFRVPSGMTGSLRVVVTDYNRDLDSNTLFFRVYDPPEISQMPPSAVQAGESFAIRGSNLLNAWVQIGDTFATVIHSDLRSILVRMPDVGDEDESVPVIVWTPSGSARSNVTRAAGLVQPEITQLPQGADILVNDPGSSYAANGRISLREAVNIASGQLNPFLNEWDDENIHVEQIYQEVRIITGYDVNNEPIYGYEQQFRRTHTENSPGGPGYEYRYEYRVVLDEHGNETNRSLIGTESLDETDEDREEGDYVNTTLFASNPSQFNLASYRDVIRVNSLASVASDSITLGPQDQIQMPGSTLWTLTGSVQALNANQLTLGTVRGGNEIRLAGQSTILSGTMDGPQITLESAIGVTLGRSSSRGVIKILSSSGHGVEIDGGGLNAVNIDFIADCAEDGIRISNSRENGLTVYSIQGCTGDGLSISGGSLNYFTGMVRGCRNGIVLTDSESCMIRGSDLSEEYALKDCTGDGIFIEGGAHHTLNELYIWNNGGNGISILNAEGVEMEDIYCVDNGGDGILLDGGNGAHKGDHIRVLGNDGNGLVIGGSTNQGNQFLSLDAGGGKYTDVNANGGDGIVLRNGTHDNLFEYCSAYGNQGSGVLITGSGTSNNRFSECDIAYDEIESGADYGNRGDGVQITAGASDNVLYKTNVGQNTGHGFSIDGGDRNQIEECFIGDRLGFRSSEDHRPNQMRGVRIAGNAVANEIRYCTFSYNVQGGVLMENLKNTTASSENPSVKISSCKFGTSKKWSDVRYNDPCIATGPAIECRDSDHIKIEDVLVFLHDGAILIDGESNQDIIINELRSIRTRAHGILARNTSAFICGPIYIGSSGQDGIHLENVADSEFFCTPMTNMTNSFCQGSTGTGVFIDSSRNVVVKDGFIGSNAKAIEVVSTEGFQFLDCWVQDNKGDALTLTGSSNITLDRPRLQNNTGIGLKIVDSSGLELIGKSPRYGFFINGNPGGSLWIENSQDIAIGKERLGGNLAATVNPSIVITGDRTRNVTVESCIMLDQRTTDCIRIDGGQGIVIGSPNADYGNDIEFNKYKGVVVRGANTRVAILNNIIGEPEQYESGARERGNDVGIVLEQGANQILIQGNIINANASHGILVHDGAHSNMIVRNQITENGGNGVQVEGATSRLNQISQNSITRNIGAGIRLVGGNDGIEAPIITKIERQQSTVSGQTNSDAPDGSQVEIYWDNDDEGRTLIGSSYLFGNKFVVLGTIPAGVNLHGVIIYPNGNTSEFGPAVLSSKPDPFLYTEERNGDTDIFLMNAVAQRSTRITRNSAQDTSPSVSPTGDRMLFVSDRSGNADIWLLPFDTFVPVQAVSNPAADYDPDWTADGSQMVYVSERDGNPEIYKEGFGGDGGADTEISYNSGAIDETVAEALCSGMRGDALGVKINSDAGRISEIHIYIQANPVPFTWKIFAMEGAQPAFLPLAEGSTEPAGTGWHIVDVGNLEVPQEYVIAVFFQQNYSPHLGMTTGGEEYRWWLYTLTRGWVNVQIRPVMIKAVIKSGGSAPQRLTNDVAVDRNPAVSPDGTRIAFASNRAGTPDIWLMDSNGENLQNLTQGQGNNWSPAWSPDGTLIAFVSDRDGNADIYVMDMSGGNVNRLTANEATDDEPVWNTSGDHILFTSNRDSGSEVYTLNISNPVPRRVTLGTGEIHGPETGNLDVEAIERQASIVGPAKSASPKTPLADRTEPFAGTDLLLTLSDVDTEPGATIRVLVQLTGAQALGNLDLVVSYESTVLRLLEPASVGLQTAHSMFEYNPVQYPSSFSPWRFNWIGAEGIDGGLSAVELVFEVLPGTSRSETFVRVQTANAYDIALNPVNCVPTDGRIYMPGNVVPVESWMLH